MPDPIASLLGQPLLRRAVTRAANWVDLQWSAAGLRVTLALDGSRTGWQWFTLDSSVLDGSDGLAF